MNDTKPPVIDSGQESISVDIVRDDGYTPIQKAAMLVGMCSTVRSDLTAINRSLISNETKDGYILSHEEAAIASARLLRAATSMAALGRIFETAMPEGTKPEEIIVEAHKVLKEASAEGILTKVESAIDGLIDRNRTPSTVMQHQG